MKIVIALLLANSVSASHAIAEDSFWYIGLSTGLDFLGDNDAGDTGDVDYELGYALGLQVGWRHERVRIEGDINFEQADIKSISGADFEMVAGGVGVYADLVEYASYKTFVPYAGIGLASLMHRPYDIDGRFFGTRTV